MRLLSPLLLTLLLSVQGAVAAKLVLVQDGKPASEIFLPGEASAVERYAATELQRAIRLSTGAELPIVTTPSSDPALHRIVIATSSNAKTLQGVPEIPSPKHKDDDQIAISHTDETLFLTGNNARSALYATYRFLEKSLGFRWFWPGESGEYFERKEGITLDNFKLKEQGAIRYRYLTINSPHYDHDTLVWMARHRMNIHFAGTYLGEKELQNLVEKGFFVRWSGHALVLQREMLEEHPEYVAEYGGRRQIIQSHDNPHLCWSNPGVQEALSEGIAKTLKAYPTFNSLGIYPADQTHFCHCAECVKMAPDVSTRYQKLWKILIGKLRPEFPDLQITTLAYQAYQPVAKEVAPFDMFQYATYNVSYRHPLDSGHPANATALKEMEEWKAKGAEIGMRGYDLIATAEPLFIPNVRYVVGEMNYLKQKGMTSFSTEVSPFGFPKEPGLPLHQTRWYALRMNLYAMGRATWEQDVNAEEIVTEWTTTIYGPKAAEPMKRYYFAMEKAWMEAPGDISYFLNPAAPYTRGFITQDLIAMAAKEFKEARDILAQEPDSERRKRALGEVEAEENLFGEWKKLYQTLEENAGHFQVSALSVEASEQELMNPDAAVWEKAIQLPGMTNASVAPVDGTELRALWTEDTLFLRAICHEVSSIPRAASLNKHDDPVWSEDALELFVNRKEGGYYHLALNPNGVRYDALSSAGFNLDTSANPNWKVETKDRKKGWSAVIALPLSEFAMRSGYHGEMRLSVKRSRQGETSGWPDASYHSPTNYGTIRLAHEEARQILFYDRTEANSQGAEMELRDRGFSVSEFPEGTEALPAEVKTIVLRYWTGVGFALAEDDVRQKLMPWVEAGGTLIISACNSIPWQNWFENEALAVQWSGWEIDPDRSSVEFSDGAWSSEPNDLREVLAHGVTPSSGFRPLGDGWETLATLRMRDDTEPVPYLLRARHGKGQLILTSSDMGYGGGHELFGNQNPKQVASLIENLTNALQHHPEANE